MAYGLLPSALIGLALAYAAPAFAQSGTLPCEQDLQRARDLYRQKVADLTEEQHRRTSDLMNAAAVKCGVGAEARSPEATALLDMLEKVQPTSQASLPTNR